MSIKIGTMLSEIKFSNYPVMLKNNNYDFLLLDCEHGGFDYNFVYELITKSNLTGIDIYIRLPDNSRGDITKYMDMGANGLILPMTNKSEDILKVVEYGKYAPLGKRGISTMRAHTQYNCGKLSDYMKSSNTRTKIFAQIETKQGLENLEEIISVDGVYGAILGPNDLACDLGSPGDVNSLIIMEAIKKLAVTAKLFNKKSGIITNNKDLLVFSQNQSLDYISVGSELSFLNNNLIITQAIFKE